MRKILVLLLILWGGLAYGANVASVDGVSDASISTINAVAGNVIGTIDGPTYNDGDTTGQAFSDNFNTDDSLTGWTQVVGSWNETNANLQSTTTSSDALILYSTATNTFSQYVEVKTVDWNLPDYDSGSVVFWAQNTTSTTDYITVLYDTWNSRFTVYGADGGPGGTWTEITAASRCTHTLTDGNYYGFEISGTANSATIYIYANGASSAARPWSSPICTWTGLDLSGYTRGYYLGFDYYQATTGNAKSDDFKGGDQ